MSANRSRDRTLVSAIAVAFLLSSCATNPDGTQRLDDRATGTFIGAAAGCVLARIAGRDCAEGAVAGAVAGFLVGWQFESAKVASAQQVNAEYQAKGVRIPRDAVVPVASHTRVKQSAPDTQGRRQVQVTSNTDLIGYGDQTPVVEQKYALYDEQNKLLQEKTEKVAAVDGAGRYETESKFTLPADAENKRYTLKTVQVVNGKAGKEGVYKVSFVGERGVMLAGLK